MSSFLHERSQTVCHLPYSRMQLWNSFSKERCPGRALPKLAGGKHRGRLMMVEEQLRKHQEWPFAVHWRWPCPLRWRFYTWSVFFTGISATRRVGLVQWKQQPISRKPGDVSLAAEAWHGHGDHHCVQSELTMRISEKGQTGCVLSSEKGRSKLQ